MPDDDFGTECAVVGANVIDDVEEISVRFVHFRFVSEVLEREFEVDDEEAFPDVVAVVFQMAKCSASSDELSSYAVSEKIIFSINLIGRKKSFVDSVSLSIVEVSFWMMLDFPDDERRRGSIFLLRSTSTTVDETNVRKR